MNLIFARNSTSTSFTWLHQGNNGNIGTGYYTISLNTWYHFVLTINSSGVQNVYMDGQLVQTATGKSLTDHSDRDDYWLGKLNMVMMD